MPEPTYLSEVRIERLPGALRHAHLPVEEEPEVFGLHGAIADHYGRNGNGKGSLDGEGADAGAVPVGDSQPRATTLDHLVSAAGGCLLGTFGSALERRGVELGERDVIAEAVGHVEEEAGTLVLRRIHVHFHLEVDEAHRSAVDQVHQNFAARCPVYRSLTPSVAITTSYEITDGPQN